MEKIKAFYRERGFAEIFLTVSLLIVGLFYEFLSCAASAALCVYLMCAAKRNGKLVFVKSLGGVTAVAVSAFYGLSVLWAVDSGMAFIGFLKFLPISLFALAVMQSGKDGAEYLNALPTAAAAMTAVSGALSLIPPLKEVFAPAGRLSGFLQYSNTFALVLLVCVIITAAKEKLRIADFICLAVFLSGILLSGSRTVFALTLLAVVLLIIFNKSRQVRATLLIITVSGVAAGALYAVLSGNFDTIGRFLTTSPGESTFVGRLLYFYDALPIILKNPFGTGYLGFYYLQQSVQTGLYSVRYVHNDFLQLMLDIGWVPAGMLIAAAVRSFFRKGASLRKRLLLLVISAHCMFDFDLQFIAVFFIYLLLLDCEKGKQYKLKCDSAVRQIPAAIAACCSLYMMTALAAAWLNLNTLSNALYPFNTDVNTALLTAETDPQQMNKFADKIISQNKYVTVAYSAKAAYAYSDGDFTNVIKYKDMAIKNAPLIYEEYEDYIIMLLTGYDLYIRANDVQSAEFCRAKITETVNALGCIEEKLSTFGKRIDDQPQTRLSEEIARYIDGI